MLVILKYNILSIIREKSVFVWALIFPIILSSIFIGMFSSLDSLESFKCVPVLVVQDQNYDNNTNFSDAITSLSENGDDRMIDPTFVSTESEAYNLLRNSAVAQSASLRDASQESQSATTYYGYFKVNDDGDPVLTVPYVGNSSSASNESIYESILAILANTYSNRIKLVKNIAESTPMVLADSNKVNDALTQGTYTVETEVTYNQPKTSVRFYYALLAMAALFAAQPAVICICRQQPNLSSLGARRQMGAQRRWSNLLISLLASWIVSFICLLLVFLFMVFVAKVNFGSRTGICVGVLAISSFFATALGALLGAVPKLPLGAKIGFLSLLTCLSSFFAGLYGQPTMELADKISQAVPWINYVNPASLISQSFYSINYYETLTTLSGYIGFIGLFSLIAFVVAGILLRRQRYASL